MIDLYILRYLLQRVNGPATGGQRVPVLGPFSQQANVLVT
jgi:hypothetical protein